MKATTGFLHVILTWAFATNVFRNLEDVSSAKTFLSFASGFALFCSWMKIRHEYRVRDADLLDKVAGYNDVDPQYGAEQEFTGFGS